MKNRLVFRILGALASSLIIVSVFLPFVSVTGYSQSLWQAHDSVGTLYLPIMIIVFGVIGVVFFSINIKTELAYTSSGALLFFLVMQTIPVIDQGTFNTLSVGYYCLAVGTVLTGAMAFLSNLRIKQKEVKKMETNVNESVSMMQQIDKLFNGQEGISNTVENESLNNVIQPLPVQDSISAVSFENNVPVNPVVFESSVQTQPASISQVQETNLVSNIPSISNQGMPNQNPVIAEFGQSANNVSNSQIPVQSMPNQNPVITEFQQPVNSVGISPVQNISTPAPVISKNNQPISQSNPVVAEFGNTTPSSQFFSQNNASASTEEINQLNGDQKVEPSVQSLQNLGSMQAANVATPPKDQNTNLDIFG